MAESIGTWNRDKLNRFVLDVLRASRTTNLPKAASFDEIEVGRKLTIKDEVAFSGGHVYEIGGTGSPGFENSWANVGGAYAPASFTKDPLGYVVLRGAVNTGSVSTVVFTLPPGFRPAYTHVFVAATSSTAGKIEVAADGTVTPTSLPGATLHLDQVRFKAA